MSSNADQLEEGTLEGGCTCGAVRYTVQVPPLIVHCCHCTWCQRESGSAFVINGLIERDRIAVLRGEIQCIDTPSASGKGQLIARCVQCQVALWSHYDFSGIGDRVAFLRAGTLDNPNAMPPDVHIFTSSKLHWCSIDPALFAGRVFNEYYRSEDIWSDASLARRQALQGAKTN